MVLLNYAQHGVSSCCERWVWRFFPLLCTTMLPSCTSMFHLCTNSVPPLYHRCTTCGPGYELCMPIRCFLGRVSIVSRARPFTQSLRWERVWSNSHSNLVLHCQHNCIRCGQLVLIVREVRFNSFLRAALC